MPRAEGEVLGSYIHRTHQVTKIHVIYTLITRYKDAIFFTKWCMCDIYNLCQHTAMAAISVYLMIVGNSVTIMSSYNYYTYLQGYKGK